MTAWARAALVSGGQRASSASRAGPRRRGGGQAAVLELDAHPVAAAMATRRRAAGLVAEAAEHEVGLEFDGLHRGAAQEGHGLVDAVDAVGAVAAAAAADEGFDDAHVTAA